MGRVKYGLTVCLSFVPFVCNADCRSESLTSAASEGGRFVVAVQEITCSGSGFATTAITDHVYLLRPGMNPSPSNQVFVVDEHGQSLNRPAIRWLSASELEITVPNKSLIGFVRKAFENVRIRVRYQPDDPQEREEWLRSLGIAAPHNQDD